MSYPHSKSETIADGIVHIAGLIFALHGSLILLWHATHGAHFTATAVYAATLVFSLFASAVYHLSPVDRTRLLFARIDHAGIYFKIAGTYTPVVAVIGTVFSYSILGIVWGLALIGAIAKLRGWATNSRGSLALYLGMGWLSVLLINPMRNVLSAQALGLIIIGGVVYSLGTIIYSRNSMTYQNAIWHCFVLIASVCFFAAIFLTI